MTIQDAKQELTRDLRSIYEEGEAGNISEWVIEAITGTKRSERIIQKNILLTPDQESRFKQYRTRLLSHEPVQYVLNEAWFCGLKFFVDPRVLIPRPETEELVEWIISNCRFPIDKLSILDIGTGSGCIPISLKRKLRKADVSACDISKGAIEVASKNASELGAIIHFSELDFLDRATWSSLPLFDIIVSNPPYIPESDRQHLQPNVAEFEPSSALFVPNDDPLIFYQAIAEFGGTHLEKSGEIYLETPEDSSIEIVNLFTEQGYKTEIKRDMQGKERMLRARWS